MWGGGDVVGSGIYFVLFARLSFYVRRFSCLIPVKLQVAIVQ